MSAARHLDYSQTPDDFNLPGPASVTGPSGSTGADGNSNPSDLDDGKKKYGMVPLDLPDYCSRREIQIYIALASFQGHDTTCFPSLQKISDRIWDESRKVKNGAIVGTRLKPQYISRVIKKLESKGWVLVTHTGRSNRYRVLMTPDSTITAKSANQIQLSKVESRRREESGDDNQPSLFTERLNQNQPLKVETESTPGVESESPPLCEANKKNIEKKNQKNMQKASASYRTEKPEERMQPQSHFRKKEETMDQRQIQPGQRAMQSPDTREPLIRDTSPKIIINPGTTAQRIRDTPQTKQEEPRKSGPAISSPSGAITGQVRNSERANIPASANRREPPWFKMLDGISANSRDMIRAAYQGERDGVPQFDMDWKDSDGRRFPSYLAIIAKEAANRVAREAV